MMCKQSKKKVTKGCKSKKICFQKCLIPCATGNFYLLNNFLKNQLSEKVLG
jgi:hypothetical protein